MLEPPLSQPWERAAMKELCDISHLLAHGMIDDYLDLCDRLDQAAETVRQMNQIGYELQPSSRPEINALRGQLHD
jgi:hypothetical protein